MGKWHLSMVGEMTRAVPITGWNTRGRPLNYILSNFLFALLVHMCSQLHVKLIVSVSH